MEKKRTNEEKKYSVLSKESIKLYAEAAGFTYLPQNVLSLLAEDVVYRLREATHNSIQYMRHSKSKRLTAQNFHDALIASDVPVSLGQNERRDPVYHPIKDGEFCFEDDPEINLLDVTAVEEKPREETRITASWLAIEGSCSSDINTTTTKPLQSNAALNFTAIDKSFSDEQFLYFEQIIKACFSTERELTDIALQDLRTNPRLSSILSQLINFISNQVEPCSANLNSSMKLLQIIQAVINNSTIYLEPVPYISVLSDCVHHFLLNDFPFSSRFPSDIFRLRDYSARLLAQFCCIWHNNMNGLLENSLQIIKDAFYDHNRSFTCHYGAITALTAFGTQALEDIFLPHLNRYWHHLTSSLSDFSRASLETLYVYGAVMFASECLFRSKCLLFLSGINSNKNSNATSSQDEGHDLSAPILSPVVPDLGHMDMSQSNDAANNLDSKSMTVNTDHFTDTDLLGPVLELPYAFITPKYTLTDMYLQFFDRFGDSFVSKLPFVDTNRLSIYQTPSRSSDDSNQLVKLGHPDDNKTGEELIQSLLEPDKSSRINRGDYNHLHDDCDIDYDFEDRSDHSSDQSDLLNFLGDDTDVTVKNIDQSHGIKLIFSKKPKSKPTPDKETDDNPEEEKTKQKMEAESLKEKLPERVLEYKTTSCYVNDLDEDDDEDDAGGGGGVFDPCVLIEQRTVMFEFVYAGLSKACQYVQKRRITIDVMEGEEMEEQSNKLHHLSLSLPFIGRRSNRMKTLGKITQRSKWRNQLQSCIPYTVL